ncbi:MAG: hypothetical protein ACOVP2_12515 [Armatimonadaceae bacterium]
MAPPTAFASVRFYYPPGDRRLSHWRVIRFDVASGKIFERWTDPLVDALPFSFDATSKRLFYSAQRRGQSENVIEVLDKPGGKPRFMACGSGPVFPSPNGEFVAIMVSAAELQILHIKTGNVLFASGNANAVAWSDEHTFRYTRSYTKWPENESVDVLFMFDVRKRSAEKVPIAPVNVRPPSVQLESYFDDDVHNYVFDEAGRRTRITGDARWTNRYKNNVIQGLQLGEQLPDGRFEVHTYAHRACGQLIGKLDVEKAEIEYWFSTPGDYKRLGDTGWMLGWPLQRWTKHGNITIDESPLYRARIETPEKWERIWPGAHHAGHLVQVG